MTPGAEGAGNDPSAAIDSLESAIRSREKGPIAKSSSSLIPATVPEAMRPFYEYANEQRAAIKRDAEEVRNLFEHLKHNAPKDASNITTNRNHAEACANAMLAYRHLEDASMRLGKVLQALDGGVSVYDRSTTVGA